jgi:hypothetical protein
MNSNSNRGRARLPVSRPGKRHKIGDDQTCADPQPQSAPRPPDQPPPPIEPTSHSHLTPIPSLKRAHSPSDENVTKKIKTSDPSLDAVEQSPVSESMLLSSFRGLYIYIVYGLV